MHARSSFKCFHHCEKSHRENLLKTYFCAANVTWDQFKYCTDGKIQSEDLICRGIYIEAVLVFLMLTHHTSSKCVALLFFQDCALNISPKKCRAGPSSQNCSTDFNGAFSAQHWTRPTDITASSL